MRSFENQPADSYEAVFFERLELLDTTVFMPQVLLLFREARISPETRQRALRILEGWLVRRALMKLTPKNYNQQVPVMLERVSDEPENADEVLLDYLRSGAGDISRWPTDEELTTYLTTRALYGNVPTKRIARALAAVEQGLYTSKVDIPSVPKSLSIEHIIPQSWEENWPLPQDGDPVELQARREERIHYLRESEWTETVVDEFRVDAVEESPVWKAVAESGYDAVGRLRVFCEPRYAPVVQQAVNPNQFEQLVGGVINANAG